MTLSRDASSALGPIYDAAASPGRWRHALDQVAANCDARAIALTIAGGRAGHSDRTMLNSTYLEFSRSFWGKIYGLRLSAHQDNDWAYLEQQNPHELTADTQVGLSAAQLDARGDYRFLRHRLGLGRRVGVRLNSDRVWFDAMSVAFDASVPQAPAPALGTLSALLPHLTKSVEIGRIFLDLRAQYAAILTALDHVHVGIAIALPSGEIIVRNAEASRILDQADGLRQGRDGHLITAAPVTTAALRDHIARASQTAQGQSNLPEMLLTLPRRSARAPLLLDIAPLSDSSAELERGLAGALITLIDPDHVPYLRMDRFVALYDLTPAEAAVCSHIIQGRSIDEIAELRATSPVTVKNQTAAILSKTGVNRRAALIRLVIRVLPPVGTPVREQAAE